MSQTNSPAAAVLASAGAAASEAAIARQIVSNMDNLDKSIAKIRDEFGAAIKRIEKAEGFGVTLDGVVKEFERQKAAFEIISRQIQTQRGGMWFPGIEDTGKNFSLVRALVSTRTGDWSKAGYEREIMEAASKAAQSSDVGWRGGALIPDQVIAPMITAILVRSVFVSLNAQATGQTRVSVIRGITAKHTKISKYDGGCLSYWMGEEDDYTESMVKVGDIDMLLKKLGTLVKITREMRDASDVTGFENFVRQDMINAMQAKLDWTIAYGSGTNNMPRGIMKNPDVTQFSTRGRFVAKANALTVSGVDGGVAAVSAIPSAANNQGAEFDYDAADEMMGALEDRNIEVDSSFSFISHPRLFRRLKRLKVANYSGQSDLLAYLSGQPRITDDQLRAIIGDFGKSTRIPVANLPGKSLGWSTNSAESKFGDVIAGNFSDVVLGMGGGIDIDDDQGRGLGFKSDHIFIKFRLHADVGYRRPESLVVTADARMQD